MDEKLTSILSESKTLKRLGSLKRHPYYNDLVNATNFLPIDSSISRRLWHLNNNLNIPKCKMCNNDAAWSGTKGGFYRTYCSSKCSYLDDERTKKIQTTNQEKYGSITPLGSQVIQQKVKKTLNEKYGVDNISLVAEVNERRKKTLIDKKNANLTKQNEIQEMIEDGYTQHEIGVNLNLSQPRVSKLLERLNLTTIQNNYSLGHRQLVDFIRDTTSYTVVTNVRDIITPYELDIFIPEINVAIEYNGVYWHSELSGKDRSYHITKTNMCDKLGIKLIHIFEHEWIEKNNIVKSRLSNIFLNNEKVYARKCSVEVISSKDANTFINENHLQGIRSAQINIGLMYEGELVSIMTFSKHPLYQYEVIRSCSKVGICVVGGISKMFEFFKTLYHPSSVMSFADRRWGDGSGYGKIGFTFVDNTQPNYWYFARKGNTKILHSRIRFQKHKLPNILTYFNGEMTEWENMQNNGYDRIWDCGSSKWIWHHI